MKLLTLLLSGAAIVSALPIRVVVVAKTDDVNPYIRLGHPVAAAAGGLAMPEIPSLEMIEPIKLDENSVLRHHRKPCSRGKSVFNWFRHLFGFPSFHHSRPQNHDLNGTRVWRLDEDDNEPEHRGPHHHHPHHHHHHGHHRKGGRHGFRHHRHPFTHRLQFALMSLGPWEGRFVAFVLGCGIGVLLRMFWVLSVLAVRGFRGSRQEREVQVDGDEVEEYFLAPPEYTDEKVALIAVPIQESRA